MNIVEFMRKIGYIPEKNFSGELHFQRRLGSEKFPRFHIYPKDEGDKKFIALHLDHKKPTYVRGFAHSGEYEGALVQEEAKRIREALNENKKEPSYL